MNLPKANIVRHKIRYIVMISVDGYMYYVLYSFYPGFMGTMEDPPEEASIEIEKVFDISFKDISKEITLDDYETLTEWLLTELNHKAQQVLYYE